jgi:DNA-binding transcriptional ArsR family regulator
LAGLSPGDRRIVSSSLFRELPYEVLSLLGQRFRLLGDPGRLRLVLLLASGERYVGDLVEASGLHQANVSHLLGQLADGGVLRRRRDGSRCYYRLADPTVLPQIDLIYHGLHQHALDLAAAVGSDPA